MNQERVELHVHTKMGEMDGTIEPGELVKRAFEMGHSGVAITDNCSVQGYIDAWRQLQCIRESGGKDFKLIYGVEALIADEDSESCENACKVTILVQNDIGREMLYWLLSEAFEAAPDRVPVISKQYLYDNKDGLLIGSCGAEGELYKAIKAGDSEYVKKSAEYDYFEIFTGNPGDAEHEKINKCIVELGKKTGKYVVASSNVRYMEKKDKLGYEILRWVDGERGGEYHNHFMKTDEMLRSFAYLGEKLAEETVIFAPQQILSMISDIEPLKEGRNIPHIAGSGFIISNTCEEALRDIYGDDVPAPVMDRYQRELKVITEKGYDFHYITAMRLVKKCRQDGYPVNYRGAAGASFIAYLLGITEVNPLPEEFGGYNLPVETFYGPDGDKSPAFYLNFVPEYIEKIVGCLKDLYGEYHVIRAGTALTVSERQAEAYVNEYLNGNNMPAINNDTKRSLIKSLSGVKRGVDMNLEGFFVIPKSKYISSFTPMQRFGNGDIVSHFFFHDLLCSLEKIDLLSYDELSILKNLSGITGVCLDDITTDDDEILQLFRSPEMLGITSDDIDGFPLGTLGIMDFQNQFAADVVMKTKPGNFRELAKVSAICHGTGTWINNGEKLIREGKAGLNEIIGTREEIMNLLLEKGMEWEDAYYVMEAVRRGEAHTKSAGRWQEYCVKMKKMGIPDWYIESCEQIKYLFPFAHALSYTLMSWRLAYYKLHYPKEFYQSYFKVKADDEIMQVIRKGKAAVAEKIDELQGKPIETDGYLFMDPALDVLAVAREMYARGAVSDDYGRSMLETVDETDHNVKLANATDSKTKIAVVGVGGCGKNMLDSWAWRKFCCEIYKNIKGVDWVEYIQMDTDINALWGMRANVWFQIGAGLTKVLVAGDDPEIGEKGAEGRAEFIAAALKDMDMVFVVCGMGGGTGTGAAPVVAKIAKDMGIFTVGVVTKPFKFESERRKNMAVSGIERLKTCVDTLIVVSNDKLLETCTRGTPFQSFFEKADENLQKGVQGITMLINTLALTKLCFVDFKVMNEKRLAHIDIDKAEGKIKAVGESLFSLLEDSFGTASKVIMDISGDFAMFDSYDESKYVDKVMRDDTNPVVGTDYDVNTENEAIFTVISMGLGEA